MHDTLHPITHSVQYSVRHNPHTSNVLLSSIAASTRMKFLSRIVPTTARLLAAAYGLYRHLY